MKKYFLLILPVLFCATFSSAQKFEFNTRCIEAYNAIQSLRFSEGRKLLEQEKLENPTNLSPWFIENTIDFLSIYINESKTEFERLQKNKNSRLDKLKSGDPNSPYYLYVQAEVILQWAFARLKFSEYVTAFSEVKKAYSLLEQNEEKFPQFIANKKSLGMLHCIVGAIPDQYKWGANLVGMNGSISQGLGELKSIIDYAENNNYIFKQEAYLYYAFLALYLQKDNATAWNVVKDLDTKTNLLNVFCVASIAMRTGRNDFAIAVLQNRPTSAQYFKYPYLDFMMGLAKMRKLDAEAPTFFNKFLTSFGGSNYIKETYQKLAWSALIKGNTEQYKTLIAQCNTKGVAVIDDDKQALLEAEAGIVPNVLLLKARLLFDGGYYKNAIQLFEGLSTDSFHAIKDKVEFTYRAGRIYHESGNPQKAKGFYVATIKNGENLSSYFAASAALQLGFIYEKEGDKEKAIIYFEQCLSMKNAEYKGGLDSQAKAGLNRIKID